MLLGRELPVRVCKDAHARRCPEGQGQAQVARSVRRQAPHCHSGSTGAGLICPASHVWVVLLAPLIILALGNLVLAALLVLAGGHGGAGGAVGVQLRDKEESGVSGQQAGGLNGPGSSQRVALTKPQQQ